MPIVSKCERAYVNLWKRFELDTCISTVYKVLYCLFKRKKRKYMEVFVKPKFSFKMKPVQNALGCFNE